MRVWLHNNRRWSDDPLANTTVVVIDVDEYLRTIETGSYPQGNVQAQLRQYWLRDLEHVHQIELPF